MAANGDKAPDLFDTTETVGFLAEEDRTDRRMLWRLGAWAVCAVGAVTLAVYVSQTAVEQRRLTQAASTSTMRQDQELQSLIKENKSEASRLALAVETLNNDRDRLYTRMSSLEQGLDSVTGTVNRRVAAAVTAAPPTPDKPVPAAVQSRPPAPAATEASPPLMASPSLMSPPDPAATTLSEAVPVPVTVSMAEPKPDVVAALPESKPLEPPARPADRGVDLGAAPGMGGLRQLWWRIARAHPDAIGLQPVIAVRERPGVAAIQLRLIAGPLDEAGAARFCESLKRSGTVCDVTSYDGQKLALAGFPPPAAPKPVRRKPVAKPVQAGPADTSPPVAAR